jgi:hypothetical protein
MQQQVPARVEERGQQNEGKRERWHDMTPSHGQTRRCEYSTMPGSGRRHPLTIATSYVTCIL